MGIMWRNLVKSLSNFRNVYRNSCSIINTNPSLYNIPRRSHHSLKIDDSLNLLLLKRLDFNRVEYFSALSTEKGKNFSPKYNICLPFSKTNRLPQFLVGSCNGLLCLDDNAGNVVLWNPSTNEFKFLPQSPAQRPENVFQSRDSFRRCCFWFDPKSQDYKVLRFMHNTFEDEEGDYLDSEPHVELYSLNSDSWKEFPNHGVFPQYYDSSFSTNGCYYWAELGLGYGHGTNAEGIIFKFDVANNKFSTLPFPDVGKPLGGPNTLDVLEFDGLLGAVVYSKLGTEKRFDVWVMKGSIWTKECSIHVSGAERPLGFWRRGEMLFFEGINRELMVFDRATGELKKLGIYSYPRTMQLVPYVERTVPLNGKTELEEHVIF